MKPAAALSLLTILLIIILGVPLTSSLYLDAKGLPTTAHVTDKIESVDERYTKTERTLKIGLRYIPRGAQTEEASIIETDAQTFDGLQRGSAVDLRYQPVSWLRKLEPWSPATRIAGQNTWDWLRARVSSLTIRMLVTILGSLAFFVLWLRIRRKFFWVLVVYILAVAFYWLSPVSEPAPVGITHATNARVRKIHKIEYIMTSEYRSTSQKLQLLRPMELLELEFVPEGRMDPVIATDTITAGTLPGLSEGKSVEIVYQADRPRIARMQGGQRDYAWTNLATLVLPWVVGPLFFMGAGAVLIVLIVAFGKLFGAGKRAH
jgi:hypothetical protein